MSCPRCGHEFDVSAALSERVRTELKERLEGDYQKRLEKAVRAAQEQAKKGLTLELEDLRQQLAEQRRKTREAEEHELALRKKTRELEERQQNLDLELERRLEHERQLIEKRVREQIDEAQHLKLKEKEKQIEQLREALEEARRKTQQGSQELQGEVLQLDIEVALRQQFPQDEIRPVPKGIRGADLVQEVRDTRGRSCGLILWEVKNTRRFQPSWIHKVKEDQRSTSAALSVIVSVSLPDEISGFGRLNGVWVSNLRSWPALAVALREQLLQVAFARAASRGKGEKMELLYDYLAGDRFRQRVEAMVEALAGMHQQLMRERRAVERLWAEREKQIQQIARNAAGMYGDIRGLIGAALPEIAALTLENALLQGQREG